MRQRGGFGHLIDGHDPDKIALRPGLYLDYVKNLASSMGGRLGFNGQIDMFTFDYVAGSGGSTEQNSALFETEIRIREGASSFDVSGNFGGAINSYVRASNKHFGRNVNVKTTTGTVTNYKKNSDGEWVEDKTEQRTFIHIQ